MKPTAAQRKVLEYLRDDECSQIEQAVRWGKVERASFSWHIGAHPPPLAPQTFTTLLARGWIAHHHTDGQWRLYRLTDAGRAASRKERESERDSRSRC